MTNELWAMAVAAFCALCLMPVAIRSRTLGHDLNANPQHVHVQPTSRLGGGIIFLAYSIGIALTAALDLVPSRPIFTLLACALPVLLAGILEDVTGRIPPKLRLAAAVASALLASALAGGIISRLDNSLLDGWLTYRLFAVVLTCFMVAGACNALNLIDGANGLAGGTALLMFVGISLVAAHIGDDLVLVQAVTIVGALAGFLFWNYPRARIFMGDGGAYFVGFMYAELSIQLVARNAQVSAWFVVVLAAYPIVETLYSIYRRAILLRTPSTQPDALHLHSMVYHRVTLPAEETQPVFNADRPNASVAPRLWLHGLLCTALAVAFHSNTDALIVGGVGYVIFYVLHYHTLWKTRRRHPIEDTRGFRDRRRGPPSRTGIPSTSPRKAMKRSTANGRLDLH